MILERRFFLVYAALALLSVALGAAVFPRLRAWLLNPPQQLTVLDDNRGCNPLGQFCTLENGDQLIELRLPAIIQPLKVFPVEVRLGGANAATVGRVSVRFNMINMDMGFNHFELQQTASVWEGQAMLPVCSAGRRDWQVLVDVVGDLTYSARFTFSLGRD